MPNHPLNSGDTGLSPALRELEDALRTMTPADRGPDACRVFFELGRASMRRRSSAWRLGAYACAACLALTIAIPAWRVPVGPASPIGPIASLPGVELHSSPASFVDADPRLDRLASRSRAITGGIDAIEALAPDSGPAPARGVTASELIESGRAGGSDRVPNLVRLLSGVVR